MKRIALMVAAVIVAACLLASTGAASEYGGKVSVGFTTVDEEGNQGVYQPTYNLYDGVNLSLERFYYAMDNGLRAYGNLKNVTMNNRNMRLGLSKTGLFGVSVSNDQYRRMYSFDESNFTRRNRTYGQAWFQPHEYIKVFGGVGVIDKHGSRIELFEPVGSDPASLVDYNHTYYHAGLTVGHKRRFATFEFRGSDFVDDVDNVLNDRNSKRFRLTAVTPLPRYSNIILNGGAQRYEHSVYDRNDTLTANTFWGGARAFFDGGWSVRYNAIWDRARRTGDLSATDNIAHAFYGDKVFKGVGGVTAGYQYRINDDVSDELQTDAYVVSGWVRPLDGLTLRAGHGMELLEVVEGRTLTGKQDRSRAWGSAKYRFEYGTIRVKVADRSIENEDIGSTADFTSVSTDLSLNYDKYGTLSASYAYYNGEYENDGGLFKFEEHVLSGDLLSTQYYNFQGGFGGTYMRSRLDLDVESFTLRLKGIYEFMPEHKISLEYAAHNFDDFADPSPVYTRYYTANVVTVLLIREL